MGINKGDRISEVTDDLPGSNWFMVAFKENVLFIHHMHRPRILNQHGKLEVLNPLPVDNHLANHPNAK